MTREELNQQKQKDILNEVRYEKRKKLTLFILKLSFILIVSFILFYLYTSFVSTKILSVNENRLINKNIPKSFNGVKIIQFSDLHFGTTIFINDVKNMVNEINKRKPDIVVFTGDLIDKNYKLSIEERENLINQLKKINTSLGKYAVFGEEDSDMFLTIMKQSDFEVLDNSYDFIYNNDSTPILMIGLNSTLSGNIDIDSAFSYFSETTHNTNIFSVTLAHEPDAVDEVLTQYNTDLFLAGHSHNGTIRAPYIGGLYIIEGAKKYNQEYYKINNTDLFISSGIGTNGPGFRLFCRPSINFFRISNK